MEWYLCFKWSAGEGAIDSRGEPACGIIQFHWDGKRGWQREFSEEASLRAVYPIHFPDTGTLDRFVKWAFSCARDMPNVTFIRSVDQSRT